MEGCGNRPQRVRAQQPFGPFVLERRIAVGGSAEVFLARPKLGSQPAARLVVKSCCARRARAGISTPRTRGRATPRGHPPERGDVFGAGMVGEEPYLAMEYVEGVDLYRLLRRADAEQRRFPPGLAAFIARRVASALGAVHSARDQEGNALHIVHRRRNAVEYLLIHRRANQTRRLRHCALRATREAGPTERRFERQIPATWRPSRSRASPSIIAPICSR